MIKSGKKDKGFTLVELLVVVAIIGILAGLVIINVTGAQKDARDAKRKTTMAELEGAIERCIFDTRGLPVITAVGSSFVITGSDPLSTKLITDGYVKRVAADPLQTAGKAEYLNYYYVFNALDGNNVLGTHDSAILFALEKADTTSGYTEYNGTYKSCNNSSANCYVIYFDI